MVKDGFHLVLFPAWGNLLHHFLVCCTADPVGIPEDFNLFRRFEDPKFCNLGVEQCLVDCVLVHPFKLGFDRVRPRVSVEPAHGEQNCILGKVVEECWHFVGEPALVDSIPFFE